MNRTCVSLTLALVFLSANCRVAAAKGAANPSPLASLADQALASINEQRRSEGVGPMKMEPRLTEAAEEFAKDLAQRQQLSHTDTKGRGPSERMRAKGYPNRACAENVGMASAEPDSIVNAWMGSSGHRRNMLKPEYLDAGIGMALSEQNAFWVLLMATGEPRGDPRVRLYDKQRNPIITMVFPVVGSVQWTDTFGAPRDDGQRKHQGQDLMAPKMTPLVACFDGIISLERSVGMGGHNMLTIEAESGYRATYMHINNDTPGTDDGLGTAEFAFPLGLRSGDRVEAGQLVGWVGDSGNAEDGPPHCHFELSDEDKVYNAATSLRAAKRINEPVIRLDSPETLPGKGEVRLDGIVRSIDLAQGEIVIELTAITGADRTPHSILKPEQRKIRLERCTIEDKIDAARKCDVRDIKAGMPICLIGRPGKPVDPIDGRKLILAGPPRPSTDAETNDLRPITEGRPPP